jgi:membrane-bound serine protease (ClpP class)
MEFLLDPNIAYVLLVVGVILALLAIVTPGTGMLEVGAFFCMLLPAYVAYRVGLNWWAPILLVLSTIPFAYAIRKPKRELYLLLSILGVIAGSLYLFPGEGWVPGVNPIVAVVVSVLSAVFTWLIVRKTLKALHAHPAHDLTLLIGQTGEAKTNIQDNGSVQVAGELWSARSQKSIPAGKMVRVVGREGFILLVEKIE